MEAELSLEQKVGQMLCFGWSGETDQESQTYSAHARELLEDMQVGGIILMGRNISPPYTQAAETLNRLQQASNLPLFTVVDQEGGMTARFGEPMTVFPSNMAIGAIHSADYARRAAQATAEELRAVGVNVNLAPAVDVNINPDNPIIGIRSYGESPELVSELGAAAVEGCQSAGVIACAKHFPGHGDTDVDSHLALPVVPYGRERLDRVELAPFITAVRAGVECIMTTHIVFPAIDPDLPATLSPRILTGLLREEMGFQGVVFTDCLEMHAISENYGPGEAAVLAVLAGADILLACHTLSIQRLIRDAILRAVNDGRISIKQIDRSLSRILSLKRKYRLDERRTVDPEKLPELLDTPEHHALQREIARESITILRDRDRILPLKLNSESDLIVIGLHRSVELLTKAIRAYHPNVRALTIGPKEIVDAVTAAREASAAIIPVCPNEPWTEPLDQDAQTELVKQVCALGKPTVVVAVREPYILRTLPEAGTCIATYGYIKSQLDAAAGVIFGLQEDAGRSKSKDKMECNPSF